MSADDLGHASKVIPIEKGTVRDHGEHPAMGPVVLVLPNGPALCHDAVSCTLITAARSSGEKFITIISAAEFNGQRLGTLAQFTADEARSFAASMLNSADLIDGGQRGVN